MSLKVFLSIFIFDRNNTRKYFLSFKQIVMKKKLLSLLLLIPAISFSQTIVRGRVCDNDKHPLPLVNVALLSAKDSSVITGTVTDSVGDYLLKFSPGRKDLYLMNYSSVGYQSRTMALTVTDSVI